MEMSVKEFLNSISNPNTKKCYRLGIRRFCEWFGRSAEEILEMRKDDLTQRAQENIVEFRNRAKKFEKELEKFHSYLLDQGFAINTARYLCLGLRQLFRYFEMPIRLRSGSKLSKSVQTGRSFPLRIEHVRKMFEVADLRERVLLSMAVDLGLRVSDFISIKKSDLPSLDQTSPISFDLMTGKESMVAHGFLSEESVELLRVYLPTLREDNNYLFPSNAQNHISDEWLNKLLQRLAEKAQIALREKKLSFHCFRKLFLSSAIDSGCGLTAGKKMCGKAIAQSDDTYLTTVNLRQKFIQLKKFLTINEQPKVETEKIESLKNAIIKLQQQLTEQKLITETISEQNIKLKPLMEFIEGFESEEKLKRFLDLLKSSSVISFPQHETALLRWDLSPELQERLKAVAEAEGKSEDDLIHEATEEEVRRLAEKHKIPMKELSKKKQKKKEQ